VFLQSSHVIWKALAEIRQTEHERLEAKYVKPDAD
jgi:hypothetical protein